MIKLISNSKKILLFTTLALVCFAGIVVFPHIKHDTVYAESSVYYTISDEENGGVCITGVNRANVSDGVLCIPAYVDNKPVVSIGRPLNNFTDSDEYVSLSNPCISSLDLSSATNLKVIKERCFKSDSSNLSGTVHFPTSLVSIEKAAFSGTHISQVYIPDSQYISLGSACFDSVEHFFFSSLNSLNTYSSSEFWSTYSNKMQVLESLNIVNISFEGLNYSIQCIAGKSYTYQCIDGSWQEDVSFSFPITSRPMYDFGGWALNGTPVSETDIVPDTDIVLSPIWLNRTHNISYVCDFPTSHLPSSFVESEGLSLPDIQTDDILSIWDGWYLDSECTQKVSGIDIGTNSDVCLYSKTTCLCPSVQISLDKEKYLYGEDISLSAVTSTLPDSYSYSLSWYIYDKTWISVSDLISDLNVGEYSVKCIFNISYNNQSYSVSTISPLRVLPHQVTVTWDTQYEFVFSNTDISPSIQVTCDTISNAWQISVTKFKDNQWIPSDMFDAGLYQISIEPLFDYVQILGDSSKQYLVSPLPITLSYTNSYSCIYYGQSCIPTLTDIPTDYGFKSEYVKEDIYIKVYNSWNNFSRRTLNQPQSKLSPVTNVGKYEYRISCTNSNYTLTGTYLKSVLEIQPQTISISWSNISFEYDGYEHIPSASATNLNGENITLSVSGAQIQANTNAIPTYTATASILDSSYTLLNPTTDFTISRTSSYIEYDCISSKFYDNQKVQISAVVKDSNGTFADNVAIYCPSDLTSIGIHEVSLSWSGDSNHFPAKTLYLCISIKTPEILYGDSYDPKLAIQNSDGFSSLNDVIVNEQTIDTLNLSKSSYNNITSLYDIQGIYSLSSLDTIHVSLNMSMPKNVKNLKDIQIFKVTNNGDLEEVPYTISNGRIQILSSQTNSTYILVLHKSNNSTLIILTISLLCATLTAICILAVSRRKRKI